MHAHRHAHTQARTHTHMHMHMCTNAHFIYHLSFIHKYIHTLVHCRYMDTHTQVHTRRIITDTLEDHEGTVNIGGRTITNLRFADDIDGLAGEEELAKLVEHLDKASTA